MVIVALTTNPERAKLIVSPSTTRGGPPTEIVWPEMEKALSPAVAVNAWPSTLNSMLIPVTPVPLIGVATAEAIELGAVLDGTIEGGVVDVIDVEAIVSGKAVYEVAAGDAGVVELWCSQAGVGVATAVPATRARGGSKTKFGSAASHILHVDHAGTKFRTSVGIASMGFRSDQIVEHCGGGDQLAPVPLIMVEDRSVRQRFIQL
jgi:hypothetical protein